MLAVHDGHERLMAAPHFLERFKDGRVLLDDIRALERQIVQPHSGVFEQWGLVKVEPVEQIGGFVVERAKTARHGGNLVLIF